MISVTRFNYDLILYKRRRRPRRLQKLSLTRVHSTRQKNILMMVGDFFFFFGCPTVVQCTRAFYCAVGIASANLFNNRTIIVDSRWNHLPLSIGYMNTIIIIIKHIRLLNKNNKSRGRSLTYLLKYLAFVDRLLKSE